MFLFGVGDLTLIMTGRGWFDLYMAHSWAKENYNYNLIVLLKFPTSFFFSKIKIVAYKNLGLCILFKYSFSFKYFLSEFKAIV